ncbi:MAG TPA: MEDS domain-containing protein [Kofleriaceae bacterium]|nr:MEDS domain-containing protein [Kofleriaceae bacterium]
MPAAVARTSSAVDTGLPLGSVPWGTHTCQFYKSERDLLDILVPFFATGLANHERCLWVASEPLPAQRARDALAEAVPDLAVRLADNQIEIIDYRDWYTRDGALTSEQVIAGWLEREQVALADGYAGLRLSGNTSWLSHDQWGSFADYEERVHHAFAGRRVLALCSYSLAQCGPSEILDVVRNHRSALVRHDGKWEEIVSATAALALVSVPQRGRASCAHSVELHERAAFPAASLAARFADALADGAATCAVVRPENLAALREALGKRVNLDAIVAEGRFVGIDAVATYATIMQDRPQLEAIVERNVGTTVRELARRFGRLRMYGELVDEFCRAGDHETAVSLERWWNRAVDELPLELHCGYTVESFDRMENVSAFQQVCDEHGVVLPRRPGASSSPDTSRLETELEQVTSIMHSEAARRAAIETAYETARSTEREIREHLVVLQRVTSALCEAASYQAIGEVVTTSIAPSLGAMRCVFVVGGELVAIRGLTTPDDPELFAAALDRLPPTWCDRKQTPAELSWLGSALVALVPLVLAGDRIGTLAFGFDRADLPIGQRALLEDLGRQVAIAVDRARSYELAEQARARAQDANAAKDRFLAMLGHELRNPLAPILTATQLMRLRSPDTLVKERASIERSVTHMIRLVDDLLDVSRIARGKIALARARLELSELVTQALEVASPTIEDRRHRVTVAVPRGLEIDADRTRMAQVVSNLLVNAAKYTRPGGTIEVTGRMIGDRVELVVEDNGIGIAPELLPHVFEMFVQGMQGTEREQGGLGLGLAIARTIVELHGGTIRADSAGVGHGSRFTIQIPRWVAAMSELPRTQTVDTILAPNGRRILVVDDNEDAAWLLAEALRLAGHDVCVSHDGLSALELARSWSPQIAFLDIGLPGMDGYALCEHLLGLPDKPRVIAVTGYGQAADRERAMSAGFDLHFVKPVSLREVQTAIDEFTKSG